MEMINLKTWQYVKYHNMNVETAVAINFNSY